MCLVNRLRNKLTDELGLERWDKVCLSRVYDWAGHVARFGKHQVDRLAWKALHWRDVNYLTFLETNYGQQCHGRKFRVWRWEMQFTRFLGKDWKEKAQDPELWQDMKGLWLSRRLTGPCGRS